MTINPIKKMAWLVNKKITDFMVYGAWSNGLSVHLVVGRPEFGFLAESD